MTRRVPLDNVEHAQLRLIDRPSVDACVNQTLIVPPEFEELQREFPILFRRDEDGDFLAVAILGLDRGENLFLVNGAWNGRTIPATLRRGPFFLAVAGEEEEADEAHDAALVIDLDDERVSESEGDPLFLSHGGAAPVLQRAAEALRTVHGGLEQSRTMFALFAELELIAPVEIEIDLGDGTNYRLADFFTISSEGLSSLGGGALEQLNRSGFLAPAIHARSSLANINRLVELKTRKLASAVDA